MRFSTEEKAQHLRDWQMSGKSISSYVKEKGLVRWTFTKWLKADREEKQCFVEVTAQATVPAPRVQEIEIEKSDIKIRIPLGLSADEFRMVVEGLRVALW
jgi:transposase-like protein